jgi:hypothetical protein
LSQMHYFLFAFPPLGRALARAGAFLAFLAFCGCSSSSSSPSPEGVFLLLLGASPSAACKRGVIPGVDVLCGAWLRGGVARPSGVALLLDELAPELEPEELDELELELDELDGPELDGPELDGPNGPELDGPDGPELDGPERSWTSRPASGRRARLPRRVRQALRRQQRPGLRAARALMYATYYTTRLTTVVLPYCPNPNRE